MKKMMLLMLIFAFVGANAQQEHTDLKWLTNFEKAKKIAKKEHKPIVMLFTGSDWCPPCRAMHNELFVNKEFIDLSKKVVLLMVDFPRRKPMSMEQRKHNQDLARRFHKGGVPTFVAVTPEGKTMGKMSGYMYGKPERDLQFFRKIIKQYNKK